MPIKLPCTNGTCRFASISRAGQRVGVDPAVLVEPVAPLRGQTLDASLDRDTAGAPQELQHVRLPQVDPSLDAEAEIARHQRLEQGAVGQENFVNKVNVLNAICRQTVDLGQQRGQQSPAVAVAEVFLGAEAAVVGASARGFHLRPGSSGDASKRWW